MSGIQMFSVICCPVLVSEQIQPWWLGGRVELDDNVHTSRCSSSVDQIPLGAAIFIDILNKKEWVYKVN